LASNLVEKIVSQHLATGQMLAGEEVGIKIDQTLLNDTQGTMAFLQFEAMGLPTVRTKLTVVYIDHQTLQDGFENADDHCYLQTAASKFGAKYSKAGNGICHQVHLERFSRPGWTLLGTDSHTPTCGAVGMLAIGAGALDGAVASGGGPFYLSFPKVVRLDLRGQLRPWCTAKDISLQILRLLTTTGNAGTVVEYGGPGISGLTVPERATITNMGTELGVTTSLFPSDEMTRKFFVAQGREKQWIELLPDENATYDRVIEIDLSTIEPNVAAPHSPGNVHRLRELAGLKVDQVLIGSCTNSSYRDLMTVAGMLQGRRVHPDVSFGVAPGSRQVFQMIARNGALNHLIDAGARILETTCGFCFGSGQGPKSGAVSVRTNNRNFEGRSGTKDAQVYLVSPEAAAAAALTGKLTDPRDLGLTPLEVAMPSFHIDDSMILEPKGTPEIVRGPNIGLPPYNDPLPARLAGKVVLKAGDAVTTDHILPGGSLTKYRSNIAKYSEYVFRDVDPSFARKCRANGKSGLASVIVAGVSYGQGSSREHAASCPMFLGVRAVIAKSIERIHLANLINFGIVPLMFINYSDYDRINSDDELVIDNVREAVGRDHVMVQNTTQGYSFGVGCKLTSRQQAIILSGGLLNHTKERSNG
jgi:aconitate hydratase